MLSHSSPLDPKRKLDDNMSESETTRLPLYCILSSQMSSRRPLQLATVHFLNGIVAYSACSVLPRRYSIANDRRERSNGNKKFGLLPLRVRSRRFTGEILFSRARLLSLSR
jgi:hypothetical protein